MKTTSLAHPRYREWQSQVTRQFSAKHFELERDPEPWLLASTASRHCLLTMHIILLLGMLVNQGILLTIFEIQRLVLRGLRGARGECRRLR